VIRQTISCQQVSTDFRRQHRLDSWRFPTSMWFHIDWSVLCQLFCSKDCTKMNFGPFHFLYKSCIYFRCNLTPLYWIRRILFRLTDIWCILVLGWAEGMHILILSQMQYIHITLPSKKKNYTHHTSHTEYNTKLQETKMVMTLQISGPLRFALDNYLINLLFTTLSCYSNISFL